MSPVKRPRAKSPPVSETNQAAIERFLAHHQKNFEGRIKDYKGTKAYKSHEILSGQVDYWKSAVSMLRFLRNINAARRPVKHGKKPTAA